MKTKHTFISVLMILAMVTTLVVVAAAPASANVSSVTCQPTAATTPVVASSAADAYTVSFVTTQPLGTFPTGGSATNGIVTITFPANTVVATGAALNTSTVSVNGGAALTVGSAAGNVSYVGATNTMIITVVAPSSAGAPSIAGGSQITVVTGVGGITNAPTVGSHTVNVRTNAEATDVTSSPAFTIAGIRVTGGPSVTAPTVAAAGTTMTVTGAGYTASQSVDIIHSVAGVVGTAIVEADGTFTGTFSQSVAGSITALDGAGVGGASFNTVGVSLTATVVPAPATGLVGSTIQVTVSGLANSTGYAVGFAGTAITPAAVTTGAALAAAITGGAGGVTSSATGTAVFTITVPAGQSAGVKTIVLKSGTPFASQAAFAAAVVGTGGSASYTVTGRSISLSPATGPAGTAVTVTGTGFSAFAAAVGSSITSTPALTFLPTPTFATDSSGNMIATITIPAGTAAGNYTITATDSNTNSATAVFTIPAAAPAVLSSLSPENGTAGTSVVATGTGFRALSSVTATFTTPAPAVTTIVGTGTTDSAGNVRITFTVPSSAPGFATVTLTDSAATARNKTFVVTASAAVVQVTDAFSTIAGQLVENYVVWSFENQTKEWLIFDSTPGAPENTLASMTKGMSYYFEVSEDTTLTYGVNSYTLYAGWNSIGWLG